MKVLYLDLLNGISGDMFLGALFDLGLNQSEFSVILSSLPLSGYELKITHVKPQNISATDFEALIADSAEQPARHLPDILKIIENSSLSVKVQEQAKQVFQALAEAEARIHGMIPEKIHFHEVGALDSLIDIIGTLVALEMLGIKRINASTPRLGCGEVVCQHGILPVPAPATLEILQGAEVKFTDEVGEKITPTGAALLKTLVSEFGVQPSGKLLAIGYGAGKRKQKNRPNLLRAVLLDSVKSEPKLLVIETNLDDMNPEILSAVAEKLFKQGALDVYFETLQMKKGRSGIKLSAIVRETDLKSISAIILRETSSFGVRYYQVERIILEREYGTVNTRWGELKVKVGYLDGEVIKVVPEFSHAKELSEKVKVPLIDIYAEVSNVKNTFRAGRWA